MATDEKLSRLTVYTAISSQLRQLREECRLSQRALGQLVDMAPERISILEDPKAKTKPNIETLLRLANALEVELEVRFTEPDEKEETSYTRWQLWLMVTKQQALLRRAAELLSPDHVSIDDNGYIVNEKVGVEWDRQRDQWLADAGVEK